MDRIEKRMTLLHSLRKQQLDHILNEYQLTYEDYQIIKIILYMEGRSIDKLLQESKLDSYSFNIIINNLIKKNFIHINHHQLYLSDEMKQIYPTVKKAVKKIDDQLTKKMSQEDISQIIQSLDKLIDYYED